MKPVITYLEGHTTWKKTLGLFIATVVLATILMTAFFGSLDINTEASLDAETYYSSETFYKYIELQGQQGRADYILLHVVDYVYIIAYVGLWCTLLFLLTKKLKLSKKLQYLLPLPLGNGLFDTLENICIDISIAAFPNKIEVLSHISGVFTLLKFTFLGITVLTILILLVLLIIKKFK